MFSVTLTALVILGSLGLQNLLIEPDIARRVVWPGALISFMLAAPITYFVGLRLHEVHRLNVDVKDAARKDPLTGLLNRHAFVEEIRRLAQTSGVLIMADIDHFKSINDTYGHD
ncbi:MAG: diguanylate cyclase, partial [Pseudomonadota bacterium]